MKIAPRIKYTLSTFKFQYDEQKHIYIFDMSKNNSTAVCRINERFRHDESAGFV